MKDELDKRNLGCSTISTGQARSFEGLSFTGAAQEVVHKTRQRFYQHIDAAAVLGAKVTVGLIRGSSSPKTKEADLIALGEALLPVVDYADQKGVTLILEAINRYETALLNTAEEVCDFIENILGGPECVGVLWDLFHANIEDADYQQALDRLGARLKHIHLADSNRSFPGFGHTDLDSILTMIKESGFREYASFECYNLPSTETVLQQTGPWVGKYKAVPSRQREGNKR